MSHIDRNKRHDFVLLFDVRDGNPNGDPDAGNMPRVDPETMQGLMTDVALKRKIRDYVATYRKEPIFIQSQVSLNSLIMKAFRDAGVEPPQVPIDDDEVIDWFADNPAELFTIEDGQLIYSGESVKQRDIRAAITQGLDDSAGQKSLRQKLVALADQLAKSGGRKITREEQEEARKQLCKDYYDIRMFGAVLSTGLNAGQVRGPVQLTFARSIHPIFPLDLPITRQARTTSARMQTGTTEMGRKPMVPYGLYRAHGFYNPFMADQTAVTDNDLSLLWEALDKMFEFDRSAARGEMTMRGLYVFTHDDPLGNAPAHRLFRLVQVDRVKSDNGAAGKDEIGVPRSFADYKVVVPEDGPVKAEAGSIVDGVTLKRLIHDA